MKSNVVKLLDKGLSKKLISNVTESQINLLITKMGLSENTMVSKDDTQTIDKLKSERKPFEVYEKEMKEDEEDPMDFEKGERTQDPHQVGPSTDDGFGNYDDGPGEFNEIKKNDNNPWAICHSQLGSDRNAKYERCVRSVKKNMDEGKSLMTFFIEEEIVSLVEKTIKPRMTKSDLMGMIAEQNPTTAPPKTKPTVKPGPRTRPAHPGKNPNPNENPAPKAKKDKLEAAKAEILKAIQDILNDGKKD
jgi:hypothetical protein